MLDTRQLAFVNGLELINGLDSDVTSDAIPLMGHRIGIEHYSAIRIVGPASIIIRLKPES